MTGSIGTTIRIHSFNRRKPKVSYTLRNEGLPFRRILIYNSQEHLTLLFSFTCLGVLQLKQAYIDLISDWL